MKTSGCSHIEPMQHGGFPKSAGRIEVTREHLVNNGAAKVLKLINGAQLKAIISKTAFSFRAVHGGSNERRGMEKRGRKVISDERNQVAILPLEPLLIKVITCIILSVYIWIAPVRSINVHCLIFLAEFQNGLKLCAHCTCAARQLDDFFQTSHNGKLRNIFAALPVISSSP